MSTELIFTLVLLVAELGLIALCRVKLKQPPNPHRPRLMPYVAITIMLSFGAMITAAHSVSLITGKQLLPKNKMKGQ